MMDAILKHYNLNSEDLIKLNDSSYDYDYSDNEEFISLCNYLKNIKGNVLVVGDYDADGITSTAILVRLLKKLNVITKYYIPDRYKEGYGLNVEILKKAINHFELVICVDNGVKAKDAISYARNNNIKIAIIDHHQYEEKPDVDFFIHSNTLEDKYRNLSAAGLSLILSNYFFKDEYNLALASIGMISDMMSVLNYNRKIIKKGHEIIKKNKYPSIYKLLEKDFDYDSISFEIGPKINAISRMGIGNVNKLVEYFLYDDDNEFLIYSDIIKEINKQRKHITSELIEKLNKRIKSKNFIEVIYNADIKEGLCGLIANKLSENYKKPVIVLSDNEDTIKGSGRSYGDFDIYEYFKSLDIFKSIGGHKKALGLSMDKIKLNDLINYIENNKVLIKEDVENYIEINQEDITSDIVDIIESLKPFGTDFNEVKFKINNIKVENHFLIKKIYSKWKLSNGMEAIYFNRCFNYENIQSLIGTFKYSSFKNKKITFMVKDYI